MVASRDMVQNAYQAAIVGQQQQQQDSQSPTKLQNWLPQSVVTAANASAPVPLPTTVQSESQPLSGSPHAHAHAHTDTAPAATVTGDANLGTSFKAAKATKAKAAKAKLNSRAGKARLSAGGGSPAVEAAKAGAGPKSLAACKGNEAFSCKECSRTFQYKSYLDKHLLIHMVLDSVSDEEEAEAAAAKEASVRNAAVLVALPPILLSRPVPNKQCSTEAPGGVNGKVRMMNRASFSSALASTPAATSSGSKAMLTDAAATAELHLRAATVPSSQPALSISTAILAAS